MAAGCSVPLPRRRPPVTPEPANHQRRRRCCLVQIGIGVPSMIPGTPGTRLAEWSRAAEDAGFASLSVTDRLAYESYDPFAAAAVAAAVTSRIQLRTAVVLGPLRPAPWLVKSA